MLRSACIFIIFAILFLSHFSWTLGTANEHFLYFLISCFSFCWTYNLSVLSRTAAEEWKNGGLNVVKQHQITCQAFWEKWPSWESELLWLSAETQLWKLCKTVSKGDSVAVNFCFNLYNIPHLEFVTTKWFLDYIVLHNCLLA